MSISGGLDKAFERIRSVGGECFQIFVKPSVQWKAGDLSLDDVESFKNERARTGIAPVVAHASYLLNPASPDKALREKSILTLALELVRCARLGVEYLILHPGSHREAGEKKGLERIAQGIDRALAKAEVPETKILLETTAGAGSQLGGRLEQLRDMLALSRNPEKVGICLDTCHVLAGGYDIVSAQGYEDFFNSFQRVIGLDRLKCLHINDSKNPLGSHVDRHEQIGFGYLDLKTFERLINDPRLNGLPFILETPKGKKGEKNWDEINIQLLKKLRKAASLPK
ncbi:MAG: deoxyribonuclease IV [Thermodesulfobacteriota bacterium]